MEPLRDCVIFVFSLNLINRSSTPGSISAEQRGDLSERVVKRVGRRPQLRARVLHDRQPSRGYLQASSHFGYGYVPLSPAMIGTVSR